MENQNTQTMRENTKLTIVVALLIWIVSCGITLAIADTQYWQNLLLIIGIISGVFTLGYVLEQPNKN